MNWKIPLFKIYSDEKDIEAVAKVIRRGTYWATGSEVEEFEKALAKYVGKTYAVCFNSGTSALHALLLAYDIHDKEVIVPSFTFIATANAIILAGGIPVFAETEQDTYGLEVVDVKEKITDKTKVIINIDYGGLPSRDLNELRKLCDEKNIIFIEDAAESLGASINGKMVGSIGDSSIFSFCQNKIITTGEGGMVVTDSKDIYEKIKLIRSHGRVDAGKDYFSNVDDSDYIQIGYNYRMPTICAALGLSQLNKIDKIIKMRKAVADYLNKNLKDLAGLKILKEIDGHQQVYQMYTIQVSNKTTRDSLKQFLMKKGIMSKVYFNPIHLKTFYQKKYGFKVGDLPKTEALSARVLSLPIYPSIKMEELDQIISAIRDFLGERHNV